MNTRRQTNICSLSAAAAKTLVLANFAETVMILICISPVGCNGYLLFYIKSR